MSYQCQLNFHLITKNVVDCQWGEWQESECDKTCGGGRRKKTRAPQLDAKHGGQDCDGYSSVVEHCHDNQCPKPKIPSRAGNLTENVVTGRLPHFKI